MRNNLRLLVLTFESLTQYEHGCCLEINDGDKSCPRKFTRSIYLFIIPKKLSIFIEVYVITA